MPKPQATDEEPNLELIHQLAEYGLEQVGALGPVVSMGVPRSQLPLWDDIQILTAQLARRPLAEAAPVGTELVIGPRARRPLRLEIPLLVSDMSFGALSEEAKRALAMGAERAGTGICSGEGGMLSEEQAANNRYLYELAPAMFGYQEDLLPRVQAFHFKAGQAAKTGTGGHLPGVKVSAHIAKVRGIPEGESSCSPASFEDLRTPADFRRFGDRVRELSGGIPVGFKLSAQHIEQDLDFALEAGADYLILDGRGGGTGGAPMLLRDHISVPTIPALARARAHLDHRGVSGQITLIATGGIRTPADCVKALALGADGIALANAAIQAIGCVGSRICHTNRCPSGVATQNPLLRRRLKVEAAAQRLERFFRATVALMQVMARACGHDHLNCLNRSDLTSWQRDVAELASISWSGRKEGLEP
jgi:glutamate synthase domain-containing protein 2